MSETPSPLRLVACVAFTWVVGIQPAGLTAQTSAGSTRIEIVAGSTAEYRVREQLARLNCPNDAPGPLDSS